MKIDPKAFIDQFRNVTAGFVEKNAGEGTIKILKSIAKGLEATLAVLDRYAAAGKDMAKDFYDKNAQGLNDYKGKLGDSLDSMTKSIKERGLLRSVKDKASEVKGKISEAYKDSKERSQGPPPAELSPDFVGPRSPGSEDASAGKPKTLLSGPFAALVTGLETLKGSIDKLNITNKKGIDLEEGIQTERQNQDRKASLKERLSSTYEKLKGRFSKRQSEVDSEKERAKTKDKGGKEGKGIFGSILAAVMGVTTMLKFGFGFLVKGFGTMLVSAIGSVLGKGLLGKGIGLIGAIAKPLAGASSGLLMGGASMLGRGALMAATAVGGAFLLKAALVAGAVYGGYRLYKYLTRNSIGSGVFGKMTRLRLLSYGFSDTHREHYNRLLEVDMLMKTHVQNQDGKVVYKRFDAAFKREVLKIFEVGQGEKEKFNLVNKWFIKRFLPAHKAFLTAYYTSGGTEYFDDIDKLSHDQVFDFASKYNYPSEGYEATQIPVFDSPDSAAEKVEFDTLLLALRQETKEKSERYKTVAPEDVQQKALKKAAEEKARKAITDQNLANQNKKVLDEGAEKTKDPVKDVSKALEERADKPKELHPVEGSPIAPVPTPTGRGIDFKNLNLLKGGDQGTGHDEGEVEKKVDVKVDKEAPLATTLTKVSKAEGPLVQPTGKLEGVFDNTDSKSIHKIDPDMYRLFSGMAKEYFDLTGKKIQVNEAFRTYAEQAELKRQKGRAAAAPGTSMHEFGLALDIASVDAEKLDKLGLMRKYGFTRPISGETWHIEAAGVSLDPRKAKTDAAFRKNAINSSPGRGGGGVGLSKNIPDSQKYKRNIALQKKLFDAGTSVELPVQVPKEEGGAGASSMPSAQVKTGENIPSTVPEKTPSNTPVVSPVGAGGGAGGGVGSGAGSGAGGELQGPIEKTEAKEGYTPKEVNFGSEKRSPIAQDTNPGLFKPSKERVGSGQENAESEPPSYAKQPNMDAGSLANLSVDQSIEYASKLVGVDANMMRSFAKIESSMRPSVKNSESSATGLFQITGGTWNHLMKRYGAKYNVPADAKPTNSYYNSVLGAAYTKENITAMEQFKHLGLREDTLLYLAHHYGAAGAKRILRGSEANPNASMVSLVSSDSYSSNRSELGQKTVKEYIAYLDAKMAKAGGGVSPAKTGENSSTKVDDKKVGVKGETPSGKLPDKPESYDKDPKHVPPKAVDHTAGGAVFEDDDGTDQMPLPSQGPVAPEPRDNPSARNHSQTLYPRWDKVFGKTEKTSPVNEEPVTPQPGSVVSSQEPTPQPGVVTPSRSGLFEALGAWKVKPQPGVVKPPLELPSWNPGGSGGSILPGLGSLMKQGMMGKVSLPAQPAPQPGSVMTLDKTESLLTNMGDTLSQIKTILQSIHDKPPASGASVTPQEATPAGEDTSQPRPVGKVDRQPSENGVSMSRRSVLA